jgi:lipopolysaccharide heptosyltransferase II
MSEGDEKDLRHFFDEGHPLVVMAPGARSHLKRWPAARFSEVADRLIQEKQVQVVLVGEEAERPIAQEVAASMRHPVVDLCGRTTLAELAALLKRAALVVTNDSACLHAADAMGAPTVAIFGPTDERKYGPRNVASVVVRRSLVCAPCELALCPYNHECMQWLTTDEVYTAAERILS